MTAIPDKDRSISSNDPQRPARTPARRDRSKRRLFWGIYVAFLGVLAFVAFRVGLWLMYSIPATELSNRIDPYRLHYSELYQRGILESRPDGETVRVLLLGGSVAEQTAMRLEQDLIAELGRPARVYNAARAAHTTRDSLNKLEFLDASGTFFDLILIYHGINDVPLNGTPRELFRDDYTHFGWYLQFEQLRANGRLTVKGAFNTAVSRLTSVPGNQEIDWGDDVKTPPVFEANLREILEIAAHHQTPVLLMTFAVHIPDNYTDEAFYAGELDYGAGDGHSCKTWGSADNVRKTVAAHNDAVRRVAADCAACPFVDMATLLEGARDFYDVCHLTEDGIRRFADHVVQKIVDDDVLRRSSIAREVE